MGVRGINMFRKIKDLNNSFDTKFRKGFNKLGGKTKSIILFVCFLVCFGAVLNMAYYLGASNLCENSGGELFKADDSFGIVCIMDNNIDVCDDNGMIRTQYNNTLYDYGINITY